jgi:hypothetical protein
MGESFQSDRSIGSFIFYTWEIVDKTSREAAKGMQPTAQAVGGNAEREQGPEGRKKLAPNVAFVVLNLILLKERYILLLEGQLLVVLFLRRDVPKNYGHVRFADAESTVTGLPSKRNIPFLMSPAGGVGFYDAGNLCRRLCGTNADQHVNMIGGAVDDERSAMHFADNTAELGEQIVRISVVMRGWRSFVLKMR